MYQNHIFLFIPNNTIPRYHLHLFQPIKFELEPCQHGGFPFGISVDLSLKDFKIFDSLSKMSFINHMIVRKGEGLLGFPQDAISKFSLFFNHKTSNTFYI